MPHRSRLSLSILGFALVVAACSSAPPETGNTFAPLAPLPAVEIPPAPTTTTTTQPEGPASVEVTGQLPAGLRNALAGLYSWRQDRDADAGTSPSGLRRFLRDQPTFPDATVTARASITRVEDVAAFAVVHVAPPEDDTTEDLLFAVNADAGWRIVGGRFADVGTWLGGEPQLLFVLGSDARIGQNQLRYRADSIHIVALAPSAEDGTIVGFPRDTYVTRDTIVTANETVGLPAGDLPRSGTKWTNLLAGRGPEIMLATAREISDLPLDGYIITGFKGFEALIRALGRLEIDLPTSVDPGNDWRDFPAGVQRLTPTRALQLARARKGVPRGDFGRSENQGRIMLAGMAMVQDLGIDRLPDLIDVLLANTWTDLPPARIMQFAAAAALIDPDVLENMVLPGRVGFAGSASVVYLNEEAVAAILADVGDDAVLNDSVEATDGE